MTFGQWERAGAKVLRCSVQGSLLWLEQEEGGREQHEIGGEILGARSHGALGSCKDFGFLPQVSRDRTLSDML